MGNGPLSSYFRCRLQNTINVLFLHESLIFNQRRKIIGSILKEYIEEVNNTDTKLCTKFMFSDK